LRTRPGADLKTLQDLLGHSSIVITADTYTSVLPLAQRRCAEATAKLVLAAAHRTQEKIRKKAAATGRPTAGTPAPAGPRTGKKPQVNAQDTGRVLPTVMTPGWHPSSTADTPQRTPGPRSSRLETC